MGVLCGHYFHWKCLEKWNDRICPVCRYDQSPPPRSFCEQCTSDVNLWNCLICGYQACCVDLSFSSHIRDHYIETSHNLCIEIETKQIFDFAEGKPVHRLIQRIINGKLIMTPSQDQDAVAQKPASALVGKKLELIQIEYDALMHHQLNSQRLYFK